MRIGTSISTKKLDEACVNEYKIPLIVLMENAVLSSLNHLDSELYSNYVIVCGVGNNGGDGLGIARQLLGKGKRVKVFIIGNIEKITECSKINYEILISMNVDIQIINSSYYTNEQLNDFKITILESQIVIDALFGTGLQRDINGVYEEIINIINENKKLTYSIDIPSGINATTGEIMGTCINANKTICFEFYKRGFLKYGNEKYIGEIIVEHLGIPDYILKKYDDKEYITEKNFVSAKIKDKDKFSYKSDYGKVTIFAGSKGFSGAAFISTESAVKTGSGLVTLVSEEEIQSILSGKLSEAMTANYNELERVEQLIKTSDAIGVGCGMGDNELTLNIIKSILEKAKCPILIDADGLNVIKNCCHILKDYKNKIVITPHLGEMSRLMNKPISYIREHRIDVAKEFAKKYNVVVLLKGYQTVITNGELTYINPTGNSSMANGGMGDCLSGIITSLIGQGLDVLEAAVCGAYIHGYIGDCLYEEIYTINATDIIRNIQKVMKDLKY